MSYGFLDIFCAKNFHFGFYNFFLLKFCYSTLSNITLTNTHSSFSTTSTSSIPSTNRRSTGLYPHINFRLRLFQIRKTAFWTEAESTFLFRFSLSFRVQQNIVPLIQRAPNVFLMIVDNIIKHFSPLNTQKTF